VQWRRVGTVAGALTSGQICYTNGTDIVCDTNSPTLSGTSVGIGTTSPNDLLTVNGTVGYMLGTDLTTTGSQNNVAIGMTSAVRYNGSATATFTGIAAGANGQILYLHNPSNYTLTLSNLSASSTAANQIITGTGGSLTVPSNTSVTLQYDPTASNTSGNTGAWRVTGSSNSANTLAAGTTGQIQFNGGTNLAADSNLFWDNTNKRLGIGTAAPQYTLDISGSTRMGSASSSGFTVTGNGTPNLVGNYVYTGTYNGASLYQNSSGANLWFYAGSTWVIQAVIGQGAYFGLSGNSSSPAIGTYTPGSGATGTLNLAAGGGNVMTVDTVGDITTNGQISIQGTGANYFLGKIVIGTTSSGSFLTTYDSGAKTASYTSGLINAFDTSSTSSINKVGMDIESTGSWTGTGATNTGLVVNATGGTANYAAIFSGGNVGIGTTTPSQLLSIGNNSAFTVSSSGALSASSAIIGGASNSITVSGNGGASSPNGTYTYGGLYKGKIYYQQGSSWYIWYNAAYSNWIISSALGNNTSNLWYISSTASTPPLSAGWGSFGGSTGSSTTAGTTAQQLVVDSFGNVTSGGVLTIQGSGNSSFVGPVGIGTTTPATGMKADIAGPVKVAGTGSETCTAATYGAMRYNSAGGYFEVCGP
jgi:hypothetical protein